MTEGTAPGDFGVGSRLAGYRLDEVIGRGGMAVVYRAYDTRLERQVAVKVLAPELAANDAFRQRFIRESRTAAAVDHPNIIPIFEAGEASGVLFIAMRFVHGQDVQTLVGTGGPLPTDQACHIISQVAAALEAAHSHGLVHRDVKPGNMLLDGSASYPGHAYLSDFGLSKHALSASALTSTGQLLGTLDYIAPEQIEGRGVDGRTDEYALACSAYTMLTGAPPFTRDESVAIMWAQMSSDPPPLTTRRPDLPAAVDAVMARALAKTAGDRYATCPDFAAALRRACGLERAGRGPGRPGPARPPGDEAPAGASPTMAAGLGGAAASGAPEHPATAAGPGPGAAASGAPEHPATAAGPGPGAAASPVPEHPATAAGRGPGAAQPGPPQPPAEQPPHQPTELGQAVPSWYPEQARPPGPAQPVGPAGPVAGGPPEPPTQGVGGAAGGQAGPPSSWYRQRPAAGPGRPGTSRVYPAARRRPAWRSPIGIALVCVAVLAVGGYFLLSSVFPQKGGAGSGQVAPLSLPGCTTQIAAAPDQPQVKARMVSTGSQAFDVVTSRHFAFVSGGGVTVLNTARTVPARLWNHPLKHSQGEALTPDGQHLLVTGGDGLAVFSVSQLEQGPAGPLGMLHSPGQKHAVEVAVTPDGRFAFVTYQNSAHVAVFNLQQALSQGFGAGDLAGLIPVGPQPIGIAMAPDGRQVYVTSKQASAGQQQAGVVYVIDVRKAEQRPAKSAIIATAGAGCGPSRVITSPDGKQVWVTASGSNALLGYDAARLAAGSGHALLARVPVGATPLGLIMVRNGSRIVVADSNRDKTSGAASNLAVVDVSRALGRKASALLGYCQSGVTPRQFALTPDGRTLLVTNTDSGQLQAVSVGQLP